MPQLFLLFGPKNRFSTFLNGACDESADTFTDLFGSLGDPLICGTIQVARNPMRKPLPRPTAFAPVAFLNH
jgi:hypothetical protein